MFFVFCSQRQNQLECFRNGKSTRTRSSSSSSILTSANCSFGCRWSRITALTRTTTTPRTSHQNCINRIMFLSRVAVAKPKTSHTYVQRVLLQSPGRFFRALSSTATSSWLPVSGRSHNGPHTNSILRHPVGAQRFQSSSPPGNNNNNNGKMNLPSWLTGEQAKPGEYLEKYTTDLTKLAADDKLDPIIGRHDEI